MSNDLPIWFNTIPYIACIWYITVRSIKANISIYYYFLQKICLLKHNWLLLHAKVILISQRQFSRQNRKSFFRQPVSGFFGDLNISNNTIYLNYTIFTNSYCEILFQQCQLIKSVFTTLHIETGEKNYFSQR